MDFDPLVRKWDHLHKALAFAAGKDLGSQLTTNWHHTDNIWVTHKIETWPVLVPKAGSSDQKMVWPLYWHPLTTVTVRHKCATLLEFTFNKHWAGVLSQNSSLEAPKKGIYELLHLQSLPWCLLAFWWMLEQLFCQQLLIRGLVMFSLTIISLNIMRGRCEEKRFHSETIHLCSSPGLG